MSNTAGMAFSGGGGGNPGNVNNVQRSRRKPPASDGRDYKSGSAPLAREVGRGVGGEGAPPYAAIRSARRGTHSRSSGTSQSDQTPLFQRSRVRPYWA